MIILIAFAISIGLYGGMANLLLAHEERSKSLGSLIFYTICSLAGFTVSISIFINFFF